MNHIRRMQTSLSERLFVLNCDRCISQFVLHVYHKINSSFISDRSNLLSYGGDVTGDEIMNEHENSICRNHPGKIEFVFIK